LDISKRIVLIFITVSLIPILFISGLAIFTIYNMSNENAEDAANALKAEELANLERISQDTALFIEERLRNYIDGVYMMEKYCEDLFNERINATLQESYFWNPTLELSQNGRTIPGRTGEYDPDYDSSDISFDVSCYYMPPADYQTPGDPFDWSSTTQYFIETSSNMDNVYRSLHDMNEDYIWLYMGFDAGVCDTRLMRNYPYDNLQYFISWYETYPFDYDPQIEEWYTNAAAISGNDVAFTPNYDPSTDWVISIGRPVQYDNGTIFGVVSGDVTLATIQSKVLDIKVLESGYAYLIGRDGGVLAHPDVEPEIEIIPSLSELEFGSETSSEAIAFSGILDAALSSEFGQTDFMKNNEEWYLTHVNITNGFTLAIVVPASEVVAPATAIRNQVLFQTTILTIALGGVLALVAVVVAIASYRRGRAVVEPIKEMTRLVEKMARQDFTRGVTTSGAMYEEIGTTVDALLSFQEACRFGNQAFIRGDLNRALANYQNLLEISQRLDIEVGEQTMYLNIGNVFRQRGDTENASEYYERALSLAKKMLEKSKELGEDETDALIRIASAYHNMALVEMDKGRYDEALQLLDDAQAIDQTLGNQQGLAKRLDAKGLVSMKAERHSEAQSQFEQAMQTAQSVGYRRSMAYISYHMGEFYETTQNLREAENAYNRAIELGKDTDELWLVVYAMKKLADVLDLLGKSSHEIRREAERLRRSIMFKKSVIFVIDYSGSMRAQDRIKAAIQGAKEILDSQVNPQDEVSIIVFNDTYREVLPLTRKGEYDSPTDNAIRKALDSLRYPNSATAFYDALGKALEELDKIESSEHRWIIALTDGQDNSSDDYSLDAIEGVRRGRKLPTIEQFIRENHLDVNLIIIGVGNELKGYVENVYSPDLGRRMTFEELLRSVCNNIPQGQYLSVVDSIDVRADIEVAFKEVGVLMAQLEVGGSTLDY
jgi:tetratricopeptide (TPR) repeat protein